MSKRWKIRQHNAAKLERSREVTAAFYDNVIAGLKQVAAHEVSNFDPIKMPSHRENPPDTRAHGQSGPMAGR